MDSMDSDDSSPPQVGEPSVDVGDWRSQLQADSRQRIVNKMMPTLTKHMPDIGQEGLQELKKIATRFEEKVYAAATSQDDYLRKISLKMLTMEHKSLNTLANAVQFNSADTDPVAFGMQPQVSKPLSTPLSQNIQNNIPPAGVQTSTGLSPAKFSAHLLQQVLQQKQQEHHGESNMLPTEGQQSQPQSSP